MNAGSGSSALPAKRNSAVSVQAEFSEFSKFSEFSESSEVSESSEFSEFSEFSDNTGAVTLAQKTPVRHNLSARRELKFV